MPPLNAQPTLHDTNFMSLPVKTADLFASMGEPLRVTGPALGGKQEFMQLQQEALVKRMHGSVSDWKLPELPDLSQFKEVVLDLESTGLAWWNGDRMIGAGLWTPDGQTRYLPIRHKVGPNIPEEQFFTWMRRELRDKRIVNIRTKFDLHLTRMEHIDLEAQGNTFGDVAHYAALLDDHRTHFNQEDLAAYYLEGKTLPPGMTGKVKEAHGYTLDPGKFAEYPAGLVAPRAEGDVMTVALLQHVMWPELTKQDLHRVREIEDGVLPVVVEMEHNGAPIDVETLARWVDESERDLEDIMYQIKRDTGCQLRTPNNRDDITRIFNTLRIEIPRVCPAHEIPAQPRCVICGAEGNPSFADALLAPIKHPTIQLLRAGIQLASLRSKFLVKYLKSTQRTGILRYELHQLPFERPKEGEGGSGDGGGAVSGRFSSAAMSYYEGGVLKTEGANIQQVMGVKKQLGEKDPVTGEYTGFTRKYIVKNLIKPQRGAWLKADASQFQFRLFAHYSNSPGVVAAYQKDWDWRGIEERKEKLTDYHDLVHDLVLQVSGKDLSRTHTKNVNFAQVFAAGVRKMARQLGVPEDQIPQRNRPLASGGPEFQKVVAISGTYHEMFPEVKPLLALTGHLAMSGHKHGDHACGRQCQAFYRQGYEHRGWVRTFLGRRARFGPGDRDYSALNRIIQGTEGDINKRTMIEVHARRVELGITERLTVHDEWSGDLHEPTPENVRRFKEVLNTQYYEFLVPILWEVNTGPSWGEAK